MAVIKGMLYSMASSRVQAIRTMDALADEIIEHLVKIAVINNEELRKHWHKEVRTWLNKIAMIRLKPDNKPVSAELIMHSLKSTAFQEIPEQYINLVIDDYDKEPTTEFVYHADEVRAIINSIIDEFAFKVEHKSYVLGNKGLDSISQYALIRNMK